MTKRKVKDITSLIDDLNDDKIKKAKISNEHEDLIAIIEEQGPRDYMEDNFNFGITKDKQSLLFGIFDGHGGDSCSKYLKESLLEAIVGHRYFDTSPMKALKYAYEQIDKLYCHKLGKKGAGSTCNVCLIRKVNDNEAILYCASVGDSRAILVKKNINEKPQELSNDHKGSRKDEQERIEKAGGVVQYDEHDDIYRVGGVLAVTRSFGDEYLKDYVIATPEVKKFSLFKKKDAFLCIASDGLWDDVKNEEVSKIVTPSLTKSVKDLAKLAFQRGSEDNLCILLLNLEKMFEEFEKEDQFNKVKLIEKPKPYKKKQSTVRQQKSKEDTEDKKDSKDNVTTNAATTTNTAATTKKRKR